MKRRYPNLKQVFYGFGIAKLKKIKNLDFQKIIDKAKKLNQKYSGCACCDKSNPKNYFTFYTIRKEGNKIYRNCKHTALFCSEKCLRLYFNNHHKEEPIPIITLLDEVAENLAIFLSVKELNRIKESDFKAEMEKRLQNYQKNLLCDYCHKHKKKRYELEINKTTEKSMSSVLNGEFCSKECLKNHFKEKYR